MTIDEAIKVKTTWRKDNYPPALADEMNADALSIEALKEYKRLRALKFSPSSIPLPGETEE